MKNFSIRLTVKFEASSELEATRKYTDFLRELPRLETSVIQQSNLYNLTDKKELKQSGDK